MWLVLQRVVSATNRNWMPRTTQTYKRANDVFSFNNLRFHANVTSTPRMNICSLYDITNVNGC